MELRYIVNVFYFILDKNSVFEYFCEGMEWTISENKIEYAFKCVMNKVIGLSYSSKRLDAVMLDAAQNKFSLLVTREICSLFFIL